MSPAHFTPEKECYSVLFLQFFWEALPRPTAKAPRGMGTRALCAFHFPASSCGRVLERIWRVVFFVVDSLLFGQHALMQDTANQNAAGFLPIKDNMLALLHAPQPRANFITLATERGIIGKELATIFKLADIAVGLDFAPGAKGINSDVEQIGFGTMRKTEPGHELTRRRGKVELLTDTLKNIALGNAAGVAFIDGGLQRGKLSLMSLFLTLQGPQRCANDFTGVLVAPALNLL